jgi:hypothetical protein
MQKRKSHGTPKNTMGRMFSSKQVKPNFPLQQRPETERIEDTSGGNYKFKSSQMFKSPTQQEPGQPVLAPIASSENVYCSTADYDRAD